MKKKFVKILSLILVFSLLSVFALVGCTDKPRKLNDVEKSIVGKWSAMSIVYTFNADGSWNTDNGHSGTFKQDGDGTNDYGHYYAIYRGKNYGYMYLFDDEPDKLYFKLEHEGFASRITDSE